jgi:AraC-like DNA-binding protein
MLSDPRLGHRSIGSVAFEVDFGDLFYFNCSFRLCYAATPSEVRQSAPKNGSPHWL